MRVLAGDVGGTNTRLAIWEPGSPEPLLARTYPSLPTNSLSDVIEGFLVAARRDLAVDGGAPVAASACLGVAGVVEGHLCRATNLPWVVDARELGRRTGIERFALVNDFVAMAHSVPELRAEDLAVFGGMPAGRREGQPIAVVGPGTGLGVGFLFWLEGSQRYQVIPSEGGHADFAPRSAMEAALMQFLARKYGRVSAERVLCGRGLGDIFQFLSEEDSLRRQVREVTRQELAIASDPAVVVTRRALDDSDPICEIAVSLFGSVLGAVAGNLALTILARGGVFVGGGIAPRIVSVLGETGMREAFEAKGRLSPVLGEIPLSVIIHPSPGLLGAAAWAAQI